MHSLHCNALLLLRALVAGERHLNRLSDQVSGWTLPHSLSLSLSLLVSLSLWIGMSLYLSLSLSLSASLSHSDSRSLSLSLIQFLPSLCCSLFTVWCLSLHYLSASSQSGRSQCLSLCRCLWLCFTLFVRVSRRLWLLLCLSLILSLSDSVSVCGFAFLLSSPLSASVCPSPLLLRYCQCLSVCLSVCLFLCLSVSVTRWLSGLRSGFIYLSCCVVSDEGTAMLEAGTGTTSFSTSHNGSCCSGNSC